MTMSRERKSGEHNEKVGKYSCGGTLRFFRISAIVVLGLFFAVAVAAQSALSATITANQTCGTVPLNVCFSATANDLNSSVPWQYDWNFGDGTYPTPNHNDPKPCHAFMGANSQYTVTVSISDGTKTAMGSILISTNPLLVNPCANVTSGPAPLLVQFNSGCGNVSGGIPPYSYDWDFGDGSPHCYDWATQHAYGNPGVYTVTLTVTDSCQPPSQVISHLTITVSQLNVTGNAYASRTCGPPNTNVCFSGTAQGGVPPYTFSWDFGDGSTPMQGPSPCHTYANAGSYPVVMTVKDSLGNTYQDNHLTIDITPPLAVVASASNNQGLAPMTIYFTSSVQGGTGPYTYNWDFGDGQSATSGNPSHTYNNPGTYTVVLTVTDSCTPAATASSTPIIIGIYPLQITAQANLSCGYAPLNVIFTGNASGGIGPYSYAWDFGDGTAGSTLQNPSHSYLAVGTYTAKLTVTDSLGSSGTASVPVTVTPVLSVSVQGTPATVGPAPLTVNVSSSVAGGTPPYTYDWNFADGSQDSHSPADQHTWATPGQYTVVLTVTDSCTPAHTQTANLAVNAYAPVTVTATANALCGTAPLNVCFNGTATGGLPPYSYSWNFGDNSPVVIGVAPCHIYSSAGNFSVTLSVTDSIGNESSTNIVVKVAQVQSLQAMASSDKAMGLAPLAVDFSATASGGDGNYTYDWNFGDGSPHGSTAVTQHLYQTPGSYTVTLTVTSLDVCGKSLTATDAHLTITVLSSPTIVLTSPTSGSSYGASVPFASIVYDDAPVVRVDYLINGNVVGSATAAPYAFTWYSSGLSGQYTASANVYDSLGRSASSATLSIRLSNPSLSGQIIQLQYPFRLKIFGSNFEPGAKVYLNEVAAPITTFKSPTVLVAKQGASLKALLPKGVPVIVTVKNPDGGLSGQATLVR